MSGSCCYLCNYDVYSQRPWHLGLPVYPSPPPHIHTRTRIYPSCWHHAFPQRVYWVIYGEPGFLALVWFGSSHAPSSLSPVSNLDRQHIRLRKTDNLLTGGGDKLYNGEKAWSSINHSNSLAFHNALPFREYYYSTEHKHKLGLCI